LSAVTSHDVSAPRFLVVGHLNKVHGTKGELFVWPLTDHPQRTFAVGQELRLGDEDGEPTDVPARHLRVATIRPFRRGFLVRFEGLESRTQAEFFAGRYLLLEMDRVQDPDEGEYFYHELLGAEVVTVEEATVGTVREVYELAPAHMLDVDRPAARSLLVPLAKPIVVRVERSPLRVVIDPPDGLLDL